MAVAQDALEQLRQAGLGTVDPGDRGVAGARARAPAVGDRADRVGELHLAERARVGRIGPDEQVRRGLPRPALLRRLRGRRRDRDARDRAREVPVRRRARERSAACRGTGQHGRLLRALRAGRHRARDAARPRGASDARAPGQLLGPLLPRRRLRRRPRHRADRLRRAAPARAGAPAQADRLRRFRLPAQDRGRPLPRGRGRGGGEAVVRHGAFLGAGRRRASSEPRRALRRRDVDDAQDARRPTVGIRPVPGGARAGDRPRDLPGSSGRTPGARDRCQGRLLQDRGVGSVSRLPGRGANERGRARRGAWSPRASRFSPAAPTRTSSSSTFAGASGPERTPRTGCTRSASRSTATPCRSTSGRRRSPRASGSARPRSRCAASTRPTPARSRRSSAPRSRPAPTSPPCATKAQISAGSDRCIRASEALRAYQNDGG